ncbi:trifunctional MMPL family transporter/lysophospholipid acyltransferase/class I SAM-dependent methyltransferase [Algoriphagus aquimarinus]|uniref:1-acyl-sn-glycerol-3-phosphate acyltransferases n=1 Tax=Algoriphagus aquimarinus TaxID=237018 RepID=A0A1I0Y1K8_9BACT|nr:trifunctional MMPL family transporter/lysophospholipid acyltransferase/class I SAM-dependent methyltransferase [Algoriphagus aquimarinus]SFB06083.1 1-acyl-sn-glycerol-3-phosphate acyltransferases [Algoriphagus aquimarinus]
MPSLNKLLPILLFILVLLVGAYSASKLDIHENLNKSIPSSLDMDALKPVIEKGEKAVFFSLNIEDFKGDNYKIDSAGTALVTALNDKFGSQLGALQYRSDIDPDIFNSFVEEHLYLFLEKSDYEAIDSLLENGNVVKALAEDKKLLSSAQGFGMAQSIANDPLHFNQFAYKRLSKGLSLQNMLATEGLFISTDGASLMVNGAVLFDPKEVSNVQLFDEQLSGFKDSWNQNTSNAELDYFGSFAIVAANAKQIKKDIILTVNLALIFIVGLLYFYYRKLSTILFFVLPGTFGIAASITFVYLFKGGISALALSASAVIMGIVVDYSFHFFSHLSQDKDAIKTRNSIAFPLIVSSFTTIVAFFSLTFANSEALRDFGLFTGLSLLFTLLFILFLLPHLIQLLGKRTMQEGSSKLDFLIEKFSSDKIKQPKWILLIILLATGFLAFFANDVAFENDLNKLNFYPDYLKKKEIAHQNINPDLEKRITIVAHGETENEAAANNRVLFAALTGNSTAHNQQVNSIASFVLPAAEIQQKSEAWETYWRENEDAFLPYFTSIADSLGYSSRAFSPFVRSIQTTPEQVNSIEFATQFESLQKLIIQDQNTSILTTVVFEKADYEQLKATISAVPGTFIVDGESVAESLVNSVKADFNLLLIIASVLVFVSMLLVYGRLELTLISFLPMVLSWIWILGLAALFGIKFNFINIMIATIIFGLGDDFSIFITDGLQTKHKYGKNALATNKAGILLSSISTIIGTGVLFFGQHPAIRSIAAISVIGISTIVILSFVVQPFLYKTLITRRTDQGKPPYTLLELAISIFAFSFFFLGCLISTILTVIVMIIPFWKLKSKKLFVHRLIQFFTWALLKFMVFLKKRYYDYELLDFNKPSVIIANHSSFLDILFIAMQHPKITFLVGPWVYNSPIFGKFIRFADYIPAFLPIEDSLEKLQGLVADGYSILVFPESHRSVDGKLTRFHKGAFYLSELLQIDITPVLLHGLHYILPKGDYYVKSGYQNMKVLPRITNSDARYGEGYSQRAKNITKYFKEEHAKFTLEREDADYLFSPLNYGYLYKGPILEWYFKIKYSHEKHNYELIHRELLTKNKIYDLGCGNGFLSYFLKLKNADREIIGVDYDEDKVAVAENCYLNDGSMKFHTEDISTMNLEPADAIILMDVLHYLSPEKKNIVLDNCLKALNPHGIFIIKDGLLSDSDKHKWTIKSEKWSTKLMKFNKVTDELSFFELAYLENWATDNQLEMKILSESDNSSNTLIAIKRVR